MPHLLNLLKLPTPQPIINHPIPNQAWIKIAVDPSQLYGHQYLLLIDYYFKFIVFEMIKYLQSSTVLNRCKKLFSQFGTTEQLVTNDGTKLTSQYSKLFSKLKYVQNQPILKLFLRTWDFEHQTISLYFHQSNRLVECAIQTVKHTLI